MAITEHEGKSGKLTSGETAAVMLGHKKAAPGYSPEKSRKEMHVRELHDGSYHVMRHYGAGESATEHSAQDLDGVHDHMEEHFGTPNEGERKYGGGESAKEYAADGVSGKEE